MEGNIRKCYLFMYMIAATIGSFSSGSLYVIAVNTTHFPLKYQAFIGTPLATIIGCMIGILLLKWGRRKILIYTNIALIPISIIGVFNDWGINPVILPLVHILYFINYLFVLIFCKEIPPFRSSGTPFILFTACQYMSYFSPLIMFYVLEKQFGIYITASGNDYIRLYAVLDFSVPAIVQIFLLIFVYVHEPPGYSVQQFSEDEAVVALRKVYRDPVTLGKQLAELNSKFDSMKYTGTGWSASFFTTKRRKTAFLITLGLFLGKYLSGYNSNQILLDTLDDIEKARILSILVMLLFFGGISIFGFITNYLSIEFLLTVGASLNVFLNIVCSIFYTLYRENEYYHVPTCCIGVLISLLQIIFIVLPSFMFAITHLMDKCILVAITFESLGYLIHLLPKYLFEDRSLASYIMQIVDTTGSILFLIFIFKYAIIFHKKFSKNKERLFWVPITDTEEDLSIDSMD